MTSLDLILERIRFVREYTISLLDATPESDWFRMPSGGVTHIAWQVGHLALAEYRLGLHRCRGIQPGDDALLPPNFLDLFGRSIDPDPDPAKYPPLSEIRAVFDRVHARVLAEVPSYTQFDLDEEVPANHRFCKTRRQFLDWCPLHEMTHAGQIGLLRRLLGHKPVW
jgi:hypothetical protein